MNVLRINLGYNYQYKWRHNMKTDKISFGTSPSIADLRATNGLPKYKKCLTEGILDAFQKLSQNGIGDKLYVSIGPITNKQKRATDVLVITYNSQSSVILNPKTLEKFSKNRISKLIMETYEKLKVSHKNPNINPGYPTGTPIVSTAHQEKIQKLLDWFGLDDLAGA